MTYTTPDGAVAGSSPGWGVRVGWSRPVEPASAVRRADGSPIGMSRYLRMRPVRASIPGETAARPESGPEGDLTHDDAPVMEIRAFVSSRQASSWLASGPTVKTDGPSPTWTAWSLSRFDSSTVLWGATRFKSPARNSTQQRLRNENSEGERLVIFFFGTTRLISSPFESLGSRVEGLLGLAGGAA